MRDKLMLSLEYRLFRKMQGVSMRKEKESWGQRLRPTAVMGQFTQWIYDIGQGDNLENEDHRFVIGLRHHNARNAVIGSSHDSSMQPAEERAEEEHVVKEIDEMVDVLSDEDMLYEYMLKLATTDQAINISSTDSDNNDMAHVKEPSCNRGNGGSYGDLEQDGQDGSGVSSSSSSSSTGSHGQQQQQLEQRTIVPYAIIVKIDAKATASAAGRAGSKFWRLFKPTHLGLCHMSLMFGGCTIEWRLDSLCIPRRTQSSRAMFCVKLSRSPMKLGELRYVAREIVRWNVLKRYTASPVNASLQSRNCQDFIFDVMELLEIDWQREINHNEHIGRRLSNLREVNHDRRFRCIDLSRFHKGDHLIRFLHWYMEDQSRRRRASRMNFMQSILPTNIEDDDGGCGGHGRGTRRQGRISRMLGCCIAPVWSLCFRKSSRGLNDERGRRRRNSSGISPSSSPATPTRKRWKRSTVFRFKNHAEFDHFFALLAQTEDFLLHPHEYRDLWEYAKCFDRAFWLNDRATKGQAITTSRRTTSATHRQPKSVLSSPDSDSIAQCPFSNPFSGSFRVIEMDNSVDVRNKT